MARFTTRVELHNPSSDDYNSLHSAMRAEGFSRIIIDSKGNRYHLPTAEYNRVEEMTTQQVLNAARRAVAKTKKSASILVTKSSERRWHNLRPV